MLVLQYRTGIYQSELSHHPDESAHVVTSLMIHDYVKTGIGTSPLRFAEDYYVHYPKVAFGIWPPLFHSTAALWMLLFTRTQPSLLIFIAFQCALCASMLAVFSRRLLPPLAAFGLGLWMILLPAFQNASSVIMVDIFLTIMEFLAMMLLVEFFRSGSMKDAIWFAICTSLAMLTKGNANALVLCGVFMLLLTRQFAILTKPAIYVAALIIVLVGGPWQVITLRLFKDTIPLSQITLSRLWTMFAGYTEILVLRLSLPVFLLALVGLAAECVPMLLGRRKDSQTLECAGAASLLLAVLAFHCIATNSNPDDRYILPALPFFLLFAAFGIRFIASIMPFRALSFAARSAVLTVLTLGWFAKTTFVIPHRPQMGFQEFADLLLPSRVSDEAVLVCSDVWGEGALITAFALGDREHHEHIVLRGSKVLSENIWITGGSYSPLFHSSAELEQYLESVPVDAIVSDLSETIWPQDREIVTQTLRANPDKWTVVSELPQGPESRHLQLYRWTGPDHSHVRKNVSIRMRLMLGRDFLLK